jgi:hypothetical protein
MPTPHKHAAVIKAWADGHAVQYMNSDGKWYDIAVQSPVWHPGSAYRIKPVIVKFRTFLWCSHTSSKPVVSVVDERAQSYEPRESWQGFIRWIGDWQEVEV